MPGHGTKPQVTQGPSNQHPMFRRCRQKKSGPVLGGYNGRLDNDDMSSPQQLSSAAVSSESGRDKLRARLAGRTGCGASTLSMTVAAVSWQRWSLDNRRNPDGRAWIPSLAIGPTSLPCVCPSFPALGPPGTGSPAPNAAPQRTGSRPGRGGQGSAAALGCHPIASILVCRRSSQSSSTTWPFSRSSIPHPSIIPPVLPNPDQP